MADPPAVPAAPGWCPACGGELGPRILACPSCRRLVHTDELTRLAEEAARRDREDDPDGAIQAWRAALMLLPAEAKQRVAIGERIDELIARPRAGKRGASVGLAGPKAKHPWWKAGIIGAALLVWKLKAVLVFVATKGKFLLLGLTKGGTLFSMLAYLGVLGGMTGWAFAAGIVLSIYIHEMGHVAELVRRGFPASAPMFVPGLGAFVRLHMRPASVVEDARIGLAGPIWGLGAAIVAWGAWLWWDQPVLGAIAKLGALINLFNLLPVWQLDGSRGFASLTRGQRFAVAAAFGAALLVTHEPLLVGLLGVALFRAFTMKPAEKPDWICLAQFLVLVGSLSALNAIPLPGIGGR